MNHALPALEHFLRRMFRGYGIPERHKSSKFKEGVNRYAV